MRWWRGGREKHGRCRPWTSCGQRMGANLCVPPASTCTAVRRPPRACTASRSRTRALWGICKVRCALVLRFEVPNTPGSASNSARQDPVAPQGDLDAHPLDFATSRWCSNIWTLSRLRFGPALRTFTITVRVGSCTQPSDRLGSHRHSPSPRVFPSQHHNDAAAQPPLSYSVSTRRPLRHDAHNSDAI